MLLLKMSIRIWILFMFGFVICSSAKVCVKRYVHGKWISTGDCGGPVRMSALQKELQLREEDEKKKKCVADKEWTVFQRRMNGSVDFYRGWNEYVKGFGNREGEFWLGLEDLHEKTKEGNVELEINMITKDSGTYLVAKYSNFQIGPGSDKYRLTVSGYSGNATGAGLAYYNNQQFSTKDADNDSRSSLNCAIDREGAWWYNSCAWSNLNGNFSKTGDKGFWWGSNSNLLRFSEMKIC